MQSSRESIEYCFVHVLEEREGGGGEMGGGGAMSSAYFTQGADVHPRD